MRKMIFGTYDTAEVGLWTLTEWELTPATPLTNFVEVPGRALGPLDMSAVLTDGEPRFGQRTLTAVFESSEGTREEREQRISQMVNWLTGWRVNITVPDKPDHYLTGRLTVEKLYNDEAHGSVQVTATCDPWFYSVAETKVTLTAEATAREAVLLNTGRLTVVPLLVITGTDASVLLQFGQASWALGPGSYKLPDLVLPQGGGVLTYSGTGTLTLTYREAVLQ